MKKFNKRKIKKFLPELISDERYETNLKHLIIYFKNINAWNNE